MTVDDKYSLLNRDNLTQPNQISLFQEKKSFPEFFCAFLHQIYIKFWNFSGKDGSNSIRISEITVSEKTG